MKRLNEQKKKNVKEERKGEKVKRKIKSKKIGIHKRAKIKAKKNMRGTHRRIPGEGETSIFFKDAGCEKNLDFGPRSTVLYSSHLSVQ